MATTFQTLDDFRNKLDEQLRAYERFFIEKLKSFREGLGPERSHIQFTSRLKSVGSLEKKLQRDEPGSTLLREGQFKLEDVLCRAHDVVGIRVIVRFPDLIAPVLLYLFNHPEIELALSGRHSYLTESDSINIYQWGLGGSRRAESMDFTLMAGLPLRVPVVKRKSGYNSFHLLLRKSKPDPGIDSELLAEVQVRTAIQDVWAELQHPRYKKVNSHGPQTSAQLDAEFRLLSESFFASEAKVDAIRRQVTHRGNLFVERCFRFRETAFGGGSAAEEVNTALVRAYDSFERCHQHLKSLGEVAPEAEIEFAEHVRTLQRVVEDRRPDITRANAEERLYNLLSEVAFLTMCSGDRATAHFLYHDVLRHEPDHFFSNYRLAGIHYDLGDLSEALRFQETAIRLLEDERSHGELRETFETLPSRTQLRLLRLFYRFRLWDQRRNLMQADPRGVELRKMRDESDLLLDIANIERPQLEPVMFARAVNATVFLHLQHDDCDKARLFALIEEAKLHVVDESFTASAKAAFLDTVASAYALVGDYDKAMLYAQVARESLTRTAVIDPWVRNGVERNFERIVQEWSQHRLHLL